METPLARHEIPLPWLVAGFVVIAGCMPLSTQLGQDWLQSLHGHSPPRDIALGFTVEPDGDGDGDSGLVVTSIESGGVAAQAGLKVGDHIAAINGRHVQTMRQARILFEQSASEAVPLLLVQGNHLRNITLTPIAAKVTGDTAHHGA